MFTGVIKLAQIDDYIAPSQSCIQPKIMKKDLKEEKATITLNDCLACSGCITSAESILIEQMSINKLIQMLTHKQEKKCRCSNDDKQQKHECKCNENKQARNQQKNQCECKSASRNQQHKVYIIVSPQALLSLSKSYKISPDCFMNLFQLFLTRSFPQKQVQLIDLNLGISICHELVYQQFIQNLNGQNNNKPIICSQCPGWVCYAQKTLTHEVTQQMSQVKSPQQLLGNLIKKLYGSQKVVSIMPCYDKKLQAIRFTMPQEEKQQNNKTVENKEVDLTLATTEVVDLISRYSQEQKIFQNQQLIQQFTNKKYNFKNAEVFMNKQLSNSIQFIEDQTSNGYIHMLMHKLNIKQYKKQQLRNSDYLQYIFEYQGEEIKMAKCYGFRNIQKIVQAIKRNKCQYKYVEVMACPGGCFGGGGQVRYEGVKNKEIIGEFEQIIQNLNRKEKQGQNKMKREQVEIMISKLTQGKNNSIKTKYKPIQKTLEQSVMNW